MSAQKIYLDTYVLQKDMRIRLPKSILSNLGAEKGVTTFDIYLDTENQSIILSKSSNPTQLSEKIKRNDNE